MRKVEVTWLDAWSSSDDAPIEAIQGLKPITRRNLGYLLSEDDEGIILAAGISEKAIIGEDIKRKDTFSDRILIPWGVIEGIMVLEQIGD